jgi:hypothetical protein
MNAIGEPKICYILADVMSLILLALSAAKLFAEVVQARPPRAVLPDARERMISHNTADKDKILDV